jgi:hypothetical protein
MSTQDDIPEDASDGALSALYHKADNVVPSAALDATILAAATQAVENKPVDRGSSRAPFSGRWPVAASAAAVIVIAILVLPLLERHVPQTEDTQPSAMDDLFDSAKDADARKAARERLPASNPGRLYAPEPALQLRSAMEQPVMDEEKAFTSGGSSAAVSAPSAKTESPTPRSQARLNAASGAPLAIFTPEMWLVKIQQLIDSGKIREAADELDRFRQAHPDYELDQNLLERLKQP